MRAIVGAFSLVRTKPGLTVRARSTNSSTEEYFFNRSRERSLTSAGGTASVGTTSSFSVSRRSAIRLVTKILRWSDESSNSATNGAAAIICSKLSKTSRIRRPRKKAFTVSINDFPPDSLTPSICATAEMSRSGLVTAASSTKKMPSGNSAKQRLATVWDKTVLPVPPVPVSVIRRTSPCRRRFSIFVISRLRPTRPRRTRRKFSSVSRARIAFSPLRATQSATAKTFPRRSTLK